MTDPHEVPLKEYIERIIAERDRGLDDRFAAQDAALQFALSEREKAVSTALTAAKEAVAAALAATKEAVTKAEAASEKRFDSVNEFRATLSDQAAMLMPRLEFEAQHLVVTDSIAALHTSVESMNVMIVAIKDANAKAEIFAAERLSAHNGLIEQMREKDALYATQSDVRYNTERLDRIQNMQSRILGGLMLASVMLPAITTLAVYLVTR